MSGFARENPDLPDDFDTVGYWEERALRELEESSLRDMIEAERNYQNAEEEPEERPDLATLDAEHLWRQ